MISKRLMNLLKYYKEFGIKCLQAHVLSSLFPYSRDTAQWRRRILKYKHKVISKYLQDHYYACTYDNVIEEEHTRGNQFKNCIWTAWLQGEDKAPEVIRLTLSSIRKNANGHPVIVLTENNIKQYIEIPAEIQKKHENGIMKHAHYADVVRMKILEQYGGIWLDATTLLYEPICEAAFSSVFFSVGFKEKDERFITDSKWIVRLMGGCRDSKYLSAISRMLSLYWKEHCMPIDYFVFDFLINLIYQNDERFHTIVDNLPQMDGSTNALRNIANEAYNREQINEIMMDHQMITLSYKCIYHKQTADGDKTNYSYLLDQYLM